MSLAAVVVAGLLVAACGDGRRHDGTGPEAAAPAASAWERITEGVAADGTVAADVAKAAFAYAIAPLPGVTVPAGEAEELPSATGALGWTLAHWQELTAQQRTAVVAALDAHDAVAAAPGGGAGRSAGGAVRRDPARTTGCFGQMLATADGPGAERFRSRLDQMIGAVGAKLHRQLSIPVYLVVDKRRLEHAAAYTWADPGPDCTRNQVEQCQIHLDPEGARATGAELTSILAHEVFHCYTFDTVGVRAFSMPMWILEGGAMWAGEDVAGGSRKSQRSWRRYLTRPGTSLFTRDYDAIGIYGHAAANGVDVWKALTAMWSAFDSEPAWKALTGDSEAILDSWPSGLLRDAARGSGWSAAGVGITADKATPVKLAAVGNGGGATLQSPAVANALGTVELTADLVDIEVTGHARLSTSDGGNHVLHGSATFCLKGDCACPGGAAPAGQQWAGAGIAVVAVTNGVRPGAVKLTGRELDCDQPPAPAGTASSDVDACLVGTWRSTSIAMVDTATGAGKHLGGGAGVVLTVRGSGEFTLAHDGSTPMREEVGGNVFSTTMSGTGHGTLTAEGGRLTVVTDDFAQTVTAQQQTALGAGARLRGSVAIGTGAYTCGAGRVSLRAPNKLGETRAEYQQA